MDHLLSIDALPEVAVDSLLQAVVVDFPKVDLMLQGVDAERNVDDFLLEMVDDHRHVLHSLYTHNVLHLFVEPHWNPHTLFLMVLDEEYLLEMVGDHHAVDCLL